MKVCSFEIYSRNKTWGK